MRLLTVFVCLIAAVLGACSSDDDTNTTTSDTSPSDTAQTTTTDTSTSPDTNTSNTDAVDALLDAISGTEGPGAFSLDFKTNTDFFTLMSTRVMGTSPHGAQQTWYSTNIQELVDSASFTAPVGTVAIKEFDMANDGEPDGLAVMIKKPAGYDTANGDWYYEMRMLDGTVMADPPAGPIAMCIGCHVNSVSTDYLAATQIR